MVVTVNTAVSGQGGLRERKKEQTRAALSWAAIRLTVEKGWDNVRVEDIAAEVGVSPRTFNNYFSSKGEAIAARHLDRTRRIGAALLERPEGEPLWDSITAAVLGQVPSARDSEGNSTLEEEWTEGIRLMTSEPALQGELLRASAVGVTALAAAVAARTGTDPERDMYPRLVAGAVGAVIQVATTHWLSVDTTTPIHSLLREALRQLAAGLPVPE
jgi:AcrR family transcriptional regulator